MSKHTPGPWEVRRSERTGHYAIYPLDDERTIGAERVADCYCPIDRDGEITANARLIAAAPELLADGGKAADLMSCIIECSEWDPTEKSWRVSIASDAMDTMIALVSQLNSLSRRARGEE